MRLRRILLILLLVGGFWYVTAHVAGDLRSLGLLKTGGGNSPLELTEAHAAPEYDTEEQNNIAIYKRVLPSVVNITATNLTFNFFYGAVPQQGQGSGFVLDRAGHVLTNYHVVAEANRGIEVQLSNKHKYSATVIGSAGHTIWRCCRSMRRICSR
jgi:S1-C subfamily serine protease